MEQEKIKQRMDKTKKHAKESQNRNIFDFKLRNDGKRHSNESPYKKHLGDFVHMRSAMARLQYKLDQEERALKRGK